MNEEDFLKQQRLATRGTDAIMLDALRAFVKSANDNTQDKATREHGVIVLAQLDALLAQSKNILDWELRGLMLLHQLLTLQRAAVFDFRGLVTRAIIAKS